MCSKNIIICILFLAFSTIFITCTSDSAVEAIDPIPVTINRFDQDFAKINDQKDIDALLDKSPNFSVLFFNNVLPISGEKSMVYEHLKPFLKDSVIADISTRIEYDYKDLGFLKTDLGTAFARLQNILPSQSIPDIFSFYSGFQYQVFLFDNDGKDGIGVGLDMFLGDRFPYLQLMPQNTAFSAYITRTFNKDHIAKKVIEVVVNDAIGDPQGDRFIDLMIHNGKKLHIIDRLLPEKSDTVIMEYSTSQLEWAKGNEANVWSYFFDQSLFYERDFKKINKLVHPSPGVPEMADQAPGRIGNYIGWQVVNNFMKRNPEYSIQDLIQSESQYILDQSKYKPKRN